MTLVTPEDQSSLTQEHFHVLLNSVRELRHVIDSLNKKAAEGEDVDLALVQKILSPADGVIRNCVKLEMILNDQQNRERGIAQAGYAVDLDTARFEVGCRLARLRACCRPG